MKNVYGVKLTKKDIENTISIAMDLQMYGYNFEYFHSEYTDKLSEENALKLWDKAKALNKTVTRKSIAEIYFS
jgi:hypothetical protein|nr:MAG TPA: hypothetical protein [Caudoviricetes sp.]